VGSGQWDFLTFSEISLKFFRNVIDIFRNVTSVEKRRSLQFIVVDADGSSHSEVLSTLDSNGLFQNGPRF
jgi:hypothetical protein